MTFKTIFFIFLFGVSTLFNALNAQSISSSTNPQQDPENKNRINLITTAVPSLLIAPDARAASLGESGAAGYSDVNSIYWNASKLAFIEKKISFSASYTPWLRALVPDMNHAYAAGHYKLTPNQTLATSFRYLSIGNNTYTTKVGNLIEQRELKEMSFDIAYARKISSRWSLGVVSRYIKSDGAFPSPYTPTQNTLAGDISCFYINNDIALGQKKTSISMGVNFSNIGGKVFYFDSLKKDFLPMNMRLGSALKINLNEHNSLAFLVDLNKLLVPTPPIYELDSLGGRAIGSNGKPIIKYGQDPERSVSNAVFTSFYDAPGGVNEELREISHSIGVEYIYDDILAIRAGYFNENKTKGSRKYMTLGAGFKYSVFNLDFSYLFSATERSPFANTYRVTLTASLL